MAVKMINTKKISESMDFSNGKVNNNDLFDFMREYGSNLTYNGLESSDGSVTGVHIEVDLLIDSDTGEVLNPFDVRKKIRDELL